MTVGRTSTAVLQSFGIVFGYQQVVLYLEPKPEHGELLTDTARTRLLINSLPLPWVEWAAEFPRKNPEEIVKHMEAVAPRLKLQITEIHKGAPEADTGTVPLQSLSAQARGRVHHRFGQRSAGRLTGSPQGR